MDNQAKIQALEKITNTLKGAGNSNEQVQITMVDGVPMIPYKAPSANNTNTAPVKTTSEIVKANVQVSNVNPQNSVPNGVMTLDSIANMNADQINQNWDAVSAVLTANGVDVSAIGN